MDIHQFKIFYLKSLVAVLFIFFSFDLYSQTRATRFQRITVDDGLPQNMVDCIIQDKHGFMWFGTWNGICRYDGYEVELFENGNHDLNNFIYSIAEDGNNNIWMGTENGLQLFKYDFGSFHEAQVQDPELKIILNSSIRAISTYQDSLLILGSPQGVFIVEAKNENINLIKKFDFDDKNLSGSVINEISKGPNDIVWIGTDDGLHSISGSKFTLQKWFKEGGLTSSNILSVYNDEFSDGLWVGTDAGLNHVSFINRDVDQVYLNDPSDPNSLPHNSVMDLIQDNHGNLILATLGGLGILNQGQDDFTTYKHDILSKYSLSNDFVNSLYKDKKGNIWIGTERGGVNFYNTNQNVFEHFEHSLSSTNGLSTNTVNSIFEDDKYIWIGTAGGGLNRFDKETGKYRHFVNNSNDENSISSDFVTSITKTKDNIYWVGTWGTGLNKFTERSISGGKFDVFIFQENNVNNNFISSIIEDPYGNLWIGSLGGVLHYNTASGEFKEIDELSGITEVGCLMFDRQNLWVGSRFGLYKVSLLDDYYSVKSIDQFKMDSENPKSISGNYIISMLKDEDGHLWFGTYGHGLNKLITNGDTIGFEKLDITNGLSNNIIYSIIQDEERMLWLSTDYGLTRLDPQSLKVRNFFIADGLLNNQYYWSAAYKNKNGKLYFGGMNGMDSFFPEWIKDRDDASDIVITDILLINESIIPGKEYNDVVVSDLGLSQTKSIKLSHEEKNLSIEFSALNYQEPEMIRYAYILEGFEKEWNYVNSNRRFASYTNLAPGNYTFKVKSSSINGEFISPPRVIEISIIPPFWETLWFQLLGLLSLVIMVVGYVKYRTYSLKRQRDMLEKRIAQRTKKINEQNEELTLQANQLKANNSELENKQQLIEGQNHKLEVQNREILTQRDKLIELNNKLKLVSQLRLSFFTNISHEFRTPLTLIISPLEKLLSNQNIKGETRETLLVINRNAQRLLHLINQIMDFRKIEKGRMDLKVSRSEISSFCTNIFQAFEPLADAKNIHFLYEESDLPQEVWFDKQKLENILYNLLSNAFKYTPENGEVYLQVKGICYQDSKLKQQSSVLEDVKNVISISVKDSGVGISKENLPLVFKRFYRIESKDDFKIRGSGIGLALTEELIKTHHGDIFVESVPGQGSVFEVQFPCLRGFYTTKEVSEENTNPISIDQQVQLLKEEFVLNGEEDEPEVFLTYDKDRFTILVVEDNKDLRRFIVHRLNHKYNILEAGNGAQGVEIAKKHNPDLIITDLMMPEVDGLELTTYLKNNLNTSHIPIIMLTAKDTEEQKIEGLESGADDYLGKPFNFDVLEVRVENLLKSRVKLKELFSGDPELEVELLSSNKKDQEFLNYARSIVIDHIKNPKFGVKDFVEQMGISRSLLHKKLTSLTNQSANEFITHLRMRKAKELLSKGGVNISEVAYLVGYNDPKYFSRLFSKMFEISPKDFMEKRAINVK